MLESWRNNNRIAHAPAETGGSSGSERFERKLSKAEKRRALQRLAPEATTIARSVANLSDPTAFESEVKRYLELRTRRSKATAARDSSASLGSDSGRFERIIPQLEQMLQESGLAYQEPEQAPRAVEEETAASVAPEANTTPETVSAPEEHTEELDSITNLPAVPVQNVDWQQQSTQQPAPEPEIIDLELDPATGSYVPAGKNRSQKSGSRPSAEKKSEKKRPEKEKADAAKDREEILSKMAEEFDQLAQTEGVDANQLLTDLREGLTVEEEAILLEKLKQLGWNLKQEQEEESPYVELAPFKDERALEQEFGKPAGKVNEKPYWLLPDGAAALLLNGHGTRIGEGGYMKMGDKHFELKDGKFNEISKEEARRRSEKITFERAPKGAAPEESKTLPEKPPEKREGSKTEAGFQQLAMDEASAPPPSSPDEYGDVQAPEYKFGVFADEASGLKHAHETFSMLYTSRDRLAQAYHEAVEGLIASDRQKFDDDLEHVFSGMHREDGQPEVPLAILYSIINEELRTNPPLKKLPKTQTERNEEKKKASEKKKEGEKPSKKKTK